MEQILYMKLRAVKPRKPTNPPSENSTAPALSRGLALLKLLNQEGSLSLEKMAGTTGWPKSSLSRLLDVLEKEGLILRDRVTRRYRAVYELTAKESTVSLLRQLAPQHLRALAKQTAQTAELYLVESTAQTAKPGLTMIEQGEPPNAVTHIRARVGDQRDLVELDATAQVFFAFGSTTMPKRKRWVWRAGVQANITAREQQRLVKQAQAQKIGLDASINPHGVFRYAIPICDGENKLRAVLALAQLCTPHGPVPPVHELISILQAEGAQLHTSLRKTG